MKERENRPLSKFSKIMMILLGVVALILIITTILDNVGLHPILPEFNLLGCVVLIVMMMVWLGVSLFRKVQKKPIKYLVTGVITFVTLLVAMYMTSFILQYGQILFYHSYATISNSAGKTAIVLRKVDVGADDLDATVARMDTRKEAIEEETGEVLGEDEYPDGAYGYEYVVRKSFLFGLFYIDSNSEGEIYLGCESEASIMYEWSEDGVLRVYLEDAEPGDEGEIIVTY